MFQNQTETITDMAVKAAPALAISGLTVYGITIPDIVQILTGLYVCLMVVDKSITLYRKFKKGGDEPQE